MAVIAPALAYALGLASAPLLFAGILLHELGHAVVARRHGVEIEEIDLWLLGGVARMKGYPKAAGDELRFALAGSAVTLAIAALFGAITPALPASAPATLRAVIECQAFVNAAILVFNLLPAFPLGGGRVARALVWGRGGDLERVRTAFAVREAGRFMSFPAVTIPAGISAEEAAQGFFVRYRRSAFPVLDGARLVGLIDLAAVERVPAGRRATTLVAEAAFLDPELVVDEHQDVAELLERPAFERVGRAIVRTADGDIGILSSTDVDRALRALDLSAPAARAHAA